VRNQIGWLGLFALLACGGCGDSSGPNGDAIGTWNLLTVDGRQLPTVIVGLGVEIQSSQIVIRSDGSFTDTYILRPTHSSTATTFHEPGRWVGDSQRITLTYSSNGTSGTGTLSGNFLTMDFDGAWIFIRQ
jgi:hypothetical protein